jgi:hypothetical protein
MNQDFYLEEAFKLPNALQFIGRRKECTGRPVASVGLREHIFSCYDGAPALFMSQGTTTAALHSRSHAVRSLLLFRRRVRICCHVAANDGVSVSRTNALRTSRHVGQGKDLYQHVVSFLG